MNYERIDRKLVHKGYIVNFYNDTISFDDGTTQIYDFIEHPGAAAVLPITKDGEVLLVRQYRNALNRFTLEIPAGGKNPSEDFETCALRELEEETGYKASKSELLCDIYTTVALMNERIPIYLATDLIESNQHLDEYEFLNVEKHSLDELVEMIYKGEIQDSKTICAILTYKTKYC